MLPCVFACLFSRLLSKHCHITFSVGRLRTETCIVLSFSFRSSSATGLGDWTIAASRAVAPTGRRWTLYHTAARPTVVVVGVGTSLNVTTGTTSKAIEENTKPTIVATITEAVVVVVLRVGARWHCTRRKLRKQPTESTPVSCCCCCCFTTGKWPPPPTQLMMIVVGATPTGSVISRVLHFAVHLTRSA